MAKKEETKDNAVSTQTTTTTTNNTTSNNTREEPKDDKVTGTWKLAAVESEGVIMGGNLSELLDLGDEGNIEVREDGTGTLKIEDKQVDFKWSEDGDAAIVLNNDGQIDQNAELNTTLTNKDGALFMAYVQEGKPASMIFTRDGKYDKAKQITMDGTKDITSEEELLGTWTMTGMNMMGISAYGDPDSLAEMNNGMESFITFEEGGVAKMNGQDGKWQIGDAGATLTSKGLTGDMTYPIKKQGEEIYIDMTGSFGDMVFITVMEKK